MAYVPEKERFDQATLPEPEPASLPIVPGPNGAILTTGEFYSPNYKRSSRGWKVDSLGNAEFQSLTIGGTSWTKGVFGGDGSDGALNIASGTTTIGLGAAAIVVKNYTSISITGTGTLAFSNPHAAGTIIILKSQGDVLLTSSSAPMIDASGMGAAGGAGGASGANGSDGTDPNALFSSTIFGKLGTTAGAGGNGGVILANLAYYAKTQVYNKQVNIIPGAGGGGGAGGPAAGNTNAGGAGGRGGGALRIECGGAFNFTTASGISVAGKVGVAGSNSNTTNRGGGGGGGGGAGMCLILYKTLTANTGTINTAGAAGGAGGKSVGGDAGDAGGGGGGGAGAYGGAGGNGGGNNSNGLAAGGNSAGGGGGGGSNTNGTTGGAAGGSDNVLVVANTEFA